MRRDLSGLGYTVDGMVQPIHELPDSIELTQHEYRVQHAALEAALYALDRSPGADPDGRVRQRVESALGILLQRIWPFLGELDAND